MCGRTWEREGSLTKHNVIDKKEITIIKMAWDELSHFAKDVRRIQFKKALRAGITRAHTGTVARGRPSGTAIIKLYEKPYRFPLSRS
jgi:hypothetical protein